MKKYMFKINPQAKPRMVKSDIWNKRKCVSYYWAFKEELGYLASQQHYQVGDVLDITFYLEMPQSWSKKKKDKFVGSVHQQTPDLDNLIKAFTDSLMTVDAKIYEIRALKYWARTGRIEVRV